MEEPAYYPMHNTE